MCLVIAGGVPAAPRGRDPWVLAMLLVATGWGTNHFVPHLLVYRARDGLSPSVLVGLFGIYALGLLPGLLLGGPASDRHGRRVLVLPAAGVLLVSQAVLAGGAELTVLLYLGRLLTGAAVGVLIAGGSAWLAETLRRSGTLTDPARSARWASVALTTGFTGGPLVAGLLAQWLPAPEVLPYVVHFAVLASILALAASVPDTAPRRAPGVDRVRVWIPPESRRRFAAQVVPMAPWVFALPAIAFVTVPGLVTTPATTNHRRRLHRPGRRALRQRSHRCPIRRPPHPPQRAPAWAISCGVAGLGPALAAVALPGAAGMTVALVASAILGLSYGLALNAGLRAVDEITDPASRGGLTGLFYVLAYLGFAAPLLLSLLARWTNSPLFGLGLAAGAATLTAAWLWATASQRHPEQPAAHR